ncbi:MAG: M48 family metalloprotease [Novosphingobium sp.]
MSRELRVGAATSAVLLAVSAPVAAQAAPAPLAALQTLDARVQSVGWRLTRGNARFCRGAVPGIGLQLQDAAGYADPRAIRAALRLPGDIAVGAVAADSPASRAGLAANDPLVEVAGQQAAALPRARPGDYARLANLHDRIDAALAATARVALVRLRNGREERLEIAGEPACPSRFEMLSEGTRAAADGRRVVVGRKLVERFPEDELLAAVLAHELAHNLLGHRARLDAQGRAWSTVKATEREADRLSVWLLTNAGYPPEAAVRFFERWGPANDLGIFTEPTHDRWETRAKRVAAEIAKMRAAMAPDPTGAANWAVDFRMTHSHRVIPAK